MVQARPETVQSSQLASTYRLKEKGKPILTGSAIGEAIAFGAV